MECCNDSRWDIDWKSFRRSDILSLTKYQYGKFRYKRLSFYLLTRRGHRKNMTCEIKRQFGGKGVFLEKHYRLSDGYYALYVEFSIEFSIANYSNDCCIFNPPMHLPVQNLLNCEIFRQIMGYSKYFCSQWHNMITFILNICYKLEQNKWMIQLT